MDYLLVLQFSGSSLSDFDELVHLEESIEKELGSAGEVDGHDFGSNEGNIFISTNDPPRAFRTIRTLLGPSVMGELKAAFRPKEGEGYTILWPPELKEFSVK